MLGAIIIIVLLVVAMPVGVAMSGAAGAGLLGWLVGRDRDLHSVDADGEPDEHLRLANSNPWAEG